MDDKDNTITTPTTDSNSSDVDDYIEGHVVEPATTLESQHQAVNALLDKVDRASKRTSRELVINPDAKRPDVKMPLRVLYQQDKLDFGKSPLWFLQACGSMTISEMNEFTRKYENELTINERIAITLITKVMQNDSVATERFWRLQEKMLNNRGIQQQVNVAIVKPDAIMTNLLNEIEQNLNLDDPNNSAQENDIDD